MKLAIYKRKENQKLPCLIWLAENGFDSFEIYEESIQNEFDDVSERQSLNMLLCSAEAGEVDAVYINDLKVISEISVIILQVLLAFQRMNLPIYYNNGCIHPDDKMVQKIHDQVINEWTRIQNESRDIDLNI